MQKSAIPRAPSDEQLAALAAQLVSLAEERTAKISRLQRRLGLCSVALTLVVVAIASLSGWWW